MLERDYYAFWSRVNSVGGFQNFGFGPVHGIRVEGRFFYG